MLVLLLAAAVAAEPEPGTGYGALRIINTKNTPVMFRINGKEHSLDPGTTTVALPAGNQYIEYEDKRGVYFLEGGQILEIELSLYGLTTIGECKCAKGSPPEVRSKGDKNVVVQEKEELLNKKPARVNSAVLIVLYPKDTKRIFVDDDERQVMNGESHYRTPTLEPGELYYYRITIVRDSGMVTKIARFAANQTVTIDFTK